MLELYPFQEDALKYAMSVQHPAFFMEMRLGKTLVSVRWVKNIEAKRVLVVMPLTAMEAWETMLTYEEEPYLAMNTLKKTEREEVLVEQALKNTDRVWTLINYEMLLSVPNIMYVPWDVVILDESLRIMNPKARVTKMCTKGFRNAKHRAILTGCPTPESLLQLFCQFEFLHGRFMGCKSYWDFRQTYFQMHPWKKYDWEPKDGKRKEIKEILHKLAFVKTRREVKMGSKKIYERRYVDMSPEQRKLYTSITKDFAYQKDGVWEETQWAPVAELWLQRLAGGFTPDGQEVLSRAKVNGVIELLGGELSGLQVAIWFRFRAELELMTEALTKSKISWVQVNADVSYPERKEAIRNFRSGRSRVFLATEKCAKYGIDCSTADCAIYYSNEWSADDRIQSEDRIVHTQKSRPLLYIDMVTRDTVDKEVVDGIHDKSFNARAVMIRHLAKGLIK